MRTLPLGALAVVMTGCLPALTPTQDPQPQPPPPQYAQPAAYPPPQQPTAAPGGPAPYQPPPAPPPQPGAQPVAQPGPAPAPYPPQPYPPPYQPAYQQPYQQPYQPPEPFPPMEPLADRRADVEVMTDFAAIGVLASSAVIVRQDIQNETAGSFLLIGGVLGGGGIGYMLTQKWPVKSGEARATSLGLGLGMANAAFLLAGNDVDDGDTWLGYLTLGGAAGAGAGFALGQQTHFTGGQAMFVNTMALAGFGTTVLIDAGASDDGEVGDAELAGLALGLDGGTALGIALAPRLDWSRARANFVAASTVVGVFVGSMFGALISDPKHDDGSDADTNTDHVLSGATVGLWTGFGAGILFSRGWAPDPRYAKGGAAAPTTTFVPMVGNGQYGLAAAGQF